MKKLKALKNPVNSITIATLLLLKTQKEYQYVPDWAIKTTCLQTGLIDEEVRKIRDIIQSSQFNFLWLKT